MIARAEWVERFAGCHNVPADQVEAAWIVEKCRCGHDNCLGWKAENLRCQLDDCEAPGVGTEIGVYCEPHIAEIAAWRDAVIEAENAAPGLPADYV